VARQQREELDDSELTGNHFTTKEIREVQFSVFVCYPFRVDRSRLTYSTRLSFGSQAKPIEPNSLNTMIRGDFSFLSESMDTTSVPLESYLVPKMTELETWLGAHSSPPKYMMLQVDHST
jgi:hypothetical protein